MNVQPLDRNNVSYFLFFQKENLTLEIDKPIGLEKAEIEIKQNSDGFGRYITFADGVELSFSPRFNHQFSKLCQNYKTHKWQNEIYFLIKISNSDFYKGRMKLDSAETDYNYYFKTKIDVNGTKEIIESKKSESINLISDKSIDEKTITPIVLDDLLTKLKKYYSNTIAQTKGENFPVSVNAGDDDGSANFVYIYPFNKGITSNDNLVIVDDYVSVNLLGASLYLELFSYYKNDFNASSNLVIELKDIDIKITNYKSGNEEFAIFRTTTEYNSDGTVVPSTETTVTLATYRTNHLVVDNLIDNFTLKPYQRIGYCIVFGSTGNKPDTTVNFNKIAKINFNAINVFDDTITKSARLIDIGKQTLKSITNDSVSVIAPRFTELGGNFYDIFATSGLLLRQFMDQPFYATWDGFLKYIKTSFNCDAQIKENEVFIGHEIDFYQNIEVGRFPFNPNDNSFKVKPNSRLVKSSFSLGYDKYEDDKNSSNTIDSIHVKSEWYLANSQPLESPKEENTISYVADQYKIENIRRESFSKDSTKTVPNDKDIYVIDTITKDGVLQNRSNEGFETENIFSPETSYNLRLSVKRLIIDYFSEFLSNVSRFTNDVISWKNTSYLNNQAAKTKPLLPSSVITKNIELVESDNITPEQLPEPTLSGDTYEFDLSYRIKFDEALELMNKIVDEKGYVTFYDEKNPSTEIKIYISELKYSWENEKLYNIKGEQKYE